MAEVTLERRVEWYDTDAAGHQHHSCIVRFVEAAEAELMRQHGLAWLFGRTPRVRHEINYRKRLWFGEVVQTNLRLRRVGTTSMTFEFEVRGQEGVAADGELIIAHAPPDASSSSPWPAEVVTAFVGEAVAK
ncbi:acyl-CoA thioesterase [Hoyosella sp. YIM 151337]|uniref:acyl-CoA thioesterase n=1 Tax=Hoyosella sp. YIM 151337 TaxID=2992742 RepID=UPI002235D443|nr:thioesterase family protein [Hoyosella sp. YIM 151337]MCW4354661.1 acyl-CoA thioesterase [Hoyosella sp. YIM 151337]